MRYKLKILKMKGFITLCFLLSIGVTAIAQQKEDRIIVLTNPSADSIQIRWAPSSDIVWQLGNKYGYILERYTIAKNGKLVDIPKTEMIALSATPIKPMDENTLEAWADKDNYVAIVKGCLYDDKKIPKDPGKDLGGFIEGKNDNEIRFGFALLAADLSITAATAHGLYFADKNVKPNEKYAYRVSVAKQPKGLTIDAAVAVGALAEPTKYNPPRELAINIKENIVTLKWFSVLDKKMYSAYDIERSIDGKNFEKINELPFIGAATDKNQEYTFYKDSLPDNNINYSYRIRGITPFAAYGPYSKVVGGRVTPDLELPSIDSVGVINNSKVYLHWLLPTDVKKITAAIYVTRAKKATGPFEELHKNPFDKKTDSYIDEKPFQNSYYRIKVITQDKRTVYSLPYLAQVMDTIAPEKPQLVKGVIDSLGIVTLTWAKNTEKDIIGYRVFKSNTADQDYIELANKIIKKNKYVDTVNIKTLSKKVFYKIIAVDKNYNPSAFSDAVQLKRPDKIAPEAAVITKTVINDSLKTVTVQWIRSESNDVVQQQLYRKNIATGTKVLLVTDTTLKMIQYEDKTVENGNNYSYTILVTDDAGNTTEARSGDVNFETGSRDAMKNFKVAMASNKKNVNLLWDTPLGGKVAYYLLFKSTDGVKFYSWQKTDKNYCTDADVKLGTKAQYKIMAVFTNDIKTKLSKAVEIIF
jgi:uncharacterized protein